MILKGMKIIEVSLVSEPCTRLPFAKKSHGGQGTPHACDLVIPFQKDEKNQTVFGIVYPFNRAGDCTQDRVIDPDELVKAEKSWRANGSKIGIMHQADAGPRVRVLVSAIAKGASRVGGLQIQKGDWVMRLQVVDPTLWQVVKGWPKGGYSIAGSAMNAKQENLMCECQTKKSEEPTEQDYLDTLELARQTLQLVNSLPDANGQDAEDVERQKGEILVRIFERESARQRREFEVQQAHDAQIRLGELMRPADAAAMASAQNMAHERSQDYLDAKRMQRARDQARGDF